MAIVAAFKSISTGHDRIDRGAQQCSILGFRELR
jgi:hypothetical protein